MAEWLMFLIIITRHGTLILNLPLYRVRDLLADWECMEMCMGGTQGLRQNAGERASDPEALLSSVNRYGVSGLQYDEE